MRQKPLFGLLVVIVVAVLFWLIGGAIGDGVMGGEAFEAWRERNFWAYLGMFAVVVVVVSLPLLWFLGRRLAKVFADQEESAAASRGVGRLAMKALAGDVAATDHLFDLLENPVPAIRYQATRALAIVDRPQIDKELFRQVRYWPGNDKLALVNTLKSSRDMRVYRLMELLANDRNPQVARRARGAMIYVMPRTDRMDDYAEKIARPRDARRADAARRAAAGKGESAGSHPETAPSTAAADVPGDDAASMSPEARAARKADRAAGEPAARRGRASRAAKKRLAADAPPTRRLSTGKIGAERPRRGERPSPGTAAGRAPKPSRPGRPSSAEPSQERPATRPAQRPPRRPAARPRTRPEERPGTPPEERRGPRPPDPAPGTTEEDEARR